MKIKLFNPFVLTDSYGANLFPPYGLAILISRLKKEGYAVDAFDYDAYFSYNSRRAVSGKKLRKRIRSLKFINFERLNMYLFEDKEDAYLDNLMHEIAGLADCSGYEVIGITVTSQQTIYPALLLAKIFKRIYGGTKIVLGGSFVADYIDDYFSKAGYIDYIIQGPGEEPLIQLLEFISANRKIEYVASLYYKNSDNDILKNKQAAFDIENESVPDYSSFCDKYYHYSEDMPGVKSILYRISRGCVNRCAYCGRFEAHSFKSAAKVATELKYLTEQNNTVKVEFTDSMINFSTEYLKELEKEFNKTGLKIQWNAYAVIDNIDLEQLRIFKNTGCSVIQYGMESADPDIIRAMGKKHSVEKAVWVLKETSKAGLKAHVFFMVGFPHETDKSRRMTKKFIEDNLKYMYKADVNMFYLPKRAPIVKNPAKYNVYDVKPYYNKKWKYIEYQFSEINGKTWKEKRKEQEKTTREIRRYVYYKLYINWYKLKIPYWLNNLLYYRVLRKMHNNYMLRHLVEALRK